MAKSRLYRILSRVVEIKPGEEIIAILLFLFFFLITAPYNFIKPLRNAYFLEMRGPLDLPIAYLLTAILVGFVVALHSKLQVKISRQLLIVSSLFFFILTCFLFWILFPREWNWLPLAFWVWANIFIAVLMAQFWITVNDVLNPREAKRLIGFFGSGGILGGIVGGISTGFLVRTKLMESQDLLLIASGMLIACGFIVYITFMWQRKKQLIIEEDKKAKGIREEPQRVGFKVCFDTVRKNFYLKLLGAVVAITWVVSVLIDFQFNSVIAVKIPALENKTSFFGFFNSGILILPFFLQLFLTSNLIKRFGIRFSLLLFPVTLLLCAVGIGVFPFLLAGSIIYFGIIIKGSDKSLSFTINQSVRELLYIPVSPELKYKAKIFIDIFINRFSKGIGAVILLILTTIAAYFWGRPVGGQFTEELLIRYVSFVSIFSFIFILAWIFLNLKVSKEYTNTVKQKLEMKWDRADKLVAEKLDVDYTKLIFDTLESRDRSSVLYAMHLFDLIKQDKLTPEVRKLISYKSDEVKVASLGPLIESDVTPMIPETDELISEEVLGKEIEEIMSLDVYQEVMKSYIEKALKDKSMESETAKMEVAKAIGLMESRSPLVQKLEELLSDASPEVSKYALESAAKLKKREYVPALIQKMSSPITREDAIAALEKYGQKIVGTIADFLGDSEEDIELRRGAASVLAHIGTQDAADFLSWELAKCKEDLDNELIDALDRIRSEKPDIQFQDEVIKDKITKEIKNYCQILIELYDLKSSGKKEEKEKGLQRNMTVSLMNIFKLLGLIYPREDIVKAYQNIRTGTKDSVAYAIELLDNILEKEMRDAIFPFIEDLSFEERLKRCLNLLKTFLDI